MKSILSPNLLSMIASSNPTAVLGHTRGENTIFTNSREDSIDEVFELHFDDVLRV